METPLEAQSGPQSTENGLLELVFGAFLEHFGSLFPKIDDVTKTYYLLHFSYIWPLQNALFNALFWTMFRGCLPDPLLGQFLHISAEIRADFGTHLGPKWDVHFYSWPLTGRPLTPCVPHGAFFGSLKPVQSNFMTFSVLFLVPLGCFLTVF